MIFKDIVNHLKKDGIEIISDVKDYGYGMFATFKDPFGNITELWEANRDEYIKMVENELENYKKNAKSMV